MAEQEIVSPENIVFACFLSFKLFYIIYRPSARGTRRNLAPWGDILSRSGENFVEFPSFRVYKMT